MKLIITQKINQKSGFVVQILYASYSDETEIFTYEVILKTEKEAIDFISWIKSISNITKFSTLFNQKREFLQGFFTSNVIRDINVTFVDDNGVAYKVNIED